MVLFRQSAECVTVCVRCEYANCHALCALRSGKLSCVEDAVSCCCYQVRPGDLPRARACLCSLSSQAECLLCLSLSCCSHLLVHPPLPLAPVSALRFLRVSDGGFGESFRRTSASLLLEPDTAGLGRSCSEAGSQVVAPEAISRMNSDAGRLPALPRVSSKGSFGDLFKWRKQRTEQDVENREAEELLFTRCVISATSVAVETNIHTHTRTHTHTHTHTHTFRMLNEVEVLQCVCVCVCVCVRMCVCVCVCLISVCMYV